MDVTRRELLAGMGGLLAAAACRTQGEPSPVPTATRPLGDALPVRGDFAIPAGQTWLNSAFIHPVPVAAANAVRTYFETRTFREPRLRSGDSLAAEVKAEFAALINAKPAEISLVQSTSVAENLVVSGLEMPGVGFGSAWLTSWLTVRSMRFPEWTTGFTFSRTPVWTYWIDCRMPVVPAF